MTLTETTNDPRFSQPEHYIETPGELAAYFDELIAANNGVPKWCTVDTEADSMHSYETKLCLIQFAVEGSMAIIDPLAIDQDGMKPFIDFLDASDVVWMHGADYDMSMFRRTYGWIPKTVWDTQTAARLLGIETFGLANLLDQNFGVKLSKQSQKADWSRRPLTEKMQAYAYNDVRYLIQLAEGFVEQLKEKRKFDWFVESCEGARTVSLEREEKSGEDQWRVNGWGKLDPHGLSFLKALWGWRDDECRRLDRPAFKLIGNQEILNLAEALQLGERVEPPHYLRPQIARRLVKAIAEAREVPESDYPKKFRRTGGMRLQIDEDFLKVLKKQRNDAAGRVGIDPTLIAPRVVLEKLAATNIDEADRQNLLLKWQRDLMES